MSAEGEWLWRVVAWYPGASRFYHNALYRRKFQAVEAARREERAAEEVGCAVHIRVYQAGMAVAEVRTKAR